MIIINIFDHFSIRKDGENSGKRGFLKSLAVAETEIKEAGNPRFLDLRWDIMQETGDICFVFRKITSVTAKAAVVELYELRRELLDTAFLHCGDR